MLGSGDHVASALQQDSRLYIRLRNFIFLSSVFGFEMKPKYHFPSIHFSHEQCLI